MPHYKQKITQLMQYPDFLKQANEEDNPLKRAFLELLFWSARRKAEIMRISQGDIYPTDEALFINFWHLKKKRNYQVVQEIPRTCYLECILGIEGRIFPYSLKWGYRCVKKTFPKLYPHYFRLNMGTQVTIQFGDAAGRTLLDITPHAFEAYTGDVELRKVYQYQRGLSKGVK